MITLLVIVIFILFAAIVGASSTIMEVRKALEAAKKEQDFITIQRNAADIKAARLEYDFNTSQGAFDRLNEMYGTLEEKFKLIQTQKISADVKMGFKTENLAGFLPYFPYKEDSDEIRALFNPIDLIVFRDDEVVFVEVKSGQSQLSDKQKKIRDQIKNGKVRFETHRMNEKGVTVK